MAKDTLKIQRFTLDNGLRVVHHHLPDSAMVALNVLYGVGSRNETADLTGIAHLFEHLMFGGSENVDDFDGLLTAAGGVSNAWTSNDFTNFYLVAPAHNAETLFYLESDRMLAPTISESSLQVQRSVVIEEFKQQCLNVPYGDLMHHLRRMVYSNHPYSWPVIGKDFSGLEKVTRSDMIEWWKNNYSPSNAVMTVVGNIDFNTTLNYAKKWFEEIPCRNNPTKAFIPVADLIENTTSTVHGNVPSTLINIAFLMDKYGTDEYLTADALTDVLASGKSSRFYQQITMNPHAPIVNAEAMITGAEDRGMLMLTARFADEKIDLSEAKNYLIEAAKSVITTRISEHELQRHKNRRRSAFILNNTSCVACAQALAEAEIHNMSPTEMLGRYERIKVESIENLAEKFFNESYHCTLYYRPLE